MSRGSFTIELEYGHDPLCTRRLALKVPLRVTPGLSLVSAITTACGAMVADLRNDSNFTVRVSSKETIVSPDPIAPLSTARVLVRSSSSGAVPWSSEDWRHGKVDCSRERGTVHYERSAESGPVSLTFQEPSFVRPLPNGGVLCDEPSRRFVFEATTGVVACVPAQSSQVSFINIYN